MAAVSDVRMQKYYDTFNNFDVNGNGVVGQDELSALVQRVTSQFGCSPGTSRYQAFERACTQVWQALLSEAGSDEQLSKEEYVNMLANASPEKIESIFDPYVEGMFELADRDSDGIITREEFEEHQRAWGLTEDQVRGTFDRLDTNNSGGLSKDEYKAFMNQFFESDDPDAPANVLSGD